MNRCIAVAAVVAVAAVACARTQSTSTPTPTPTAQATHRERARSILEEHCGLCHLPPEVGGGSGMALHIYDLTQPDWSATLSDAQLPIVASKLVDDGAAKDEVATLTKFIADELAWRDAHPDVYARALRDAPPHAP